jgi:3-phenylpropionate/trans-cinnamate dioxygenase ferredoxin subunit
MRRDWMSPLIDIGATDDLADGAIKMVSVEGRDLLLARVGGDYYAADDRCPHMGGRLSHGRLEGTVVTCPRHGSRFDLTDGHVVRWTKWSGITLSLAKILRSPRPIKIYRVQPQGDRLMVDVEQTLYA